jgi:hypothetical protein
LPIELVLQEGEKTSHDVGKNSDILVTEGHVHLD